jgi:hypothetical protein
MQFLFSGLNHRPYIHQFFKMATICTTTLSPLLQIAVFIIIYNHYLPKILELKNQVLKLRFKILINYSAVCCRIRSWSTVLGTF